MDSKQIRENFLKFIQMEPRNHAIVPNMSVVPLNDPTLLFVNSGMFPLVPYLQGQEHPKGKRLANFQRCVRTIDIDEVGDYSHCTLFEMIGNWSLGDYGKKEQIPWMFELYTQYFGLDPKRCYVSIWGGDENIPIDQEAIDIWKEVFRKYGIEAEYSDDINNIPNSIEEGQEWKYRIFPFGSKDNWWQRGATVEGEIGGPTSELFYDLGEIQVEQDSYDINDDSGRFLEVGNSVFMEYTFTSGDWKPMEQKNIDFGGGFERIVVASQDKKSVYETDLFTGYIEKIEELSGKVYKPQLPNDSETRSFRIIAEHARSSTFLLADHVLPSNKDQGYILRRLIRRLIRHGLKLGIEGNFTHVLAQSVIEKMSDAYPHLSKNKKQILEEVSKEEARFAKTIKQGIKELNKIIEKQTTIDGKTAFKVYETYGFPIEMIIDEAKEHYSISEKEKERLIRDFEEAQKKHQQLSKSGAAKKFTGGLADHSERTTALHTTHHLLLAALQEVLGDHVKQRGSNITSERLRIDFSHPEKLTPEQRIAVETIVRKKIMEELDVIKKTMQKQEAEQLGAQMEFGQKYNDVVDIYFIQSDSDHIFSKEFCGGPHISNTSELKQYGEFSIFSEKSNGSGIRRIKAGFKQ